MEAKREFTLDELCGLTDLNKRTVRYYVQLGLVDRPEGETRAARYGARHLEQLLQIRRWVQEGVALERIRELLAGAHTAVPQRQRPPGSIEVWSHMLLADGVELHVEAARAGLSPQQLRQFYAAVLDAYARVQAATDQQ